MTKVTTKTENGFTIVSKEISDVDIQKKCDGIGITCDVEGLEVLSKLIDVYFDTNNLENIPEYRELFTNLHWNLLKEKLGYDKYETVHNEKYNFDQYHILYRDDEQIIIGEFDDTWNSIDDMDSIKRWISNISEFIEVYRMRREDFPNENVTSLLYGELGLSSLNITIQNN